MVTLGSGFWIIIWLIIEFKQEKKLYAWITFTGSKENIEHWIGDPLFEFISHDVTEPFQYSVDRMWYLACPAAQIHYQSSLLKTANTSFLAT